MKAQKLNRRQACWTLYLSRFDFTLKHVPGTKMGKADELSRRLDQKVGVEKDNDNQIFIKDCWLCSLHKVVIDGPEVDIVEKIKKARSKDKEVVRVVEEMKKVGVKVVRGEEWQIEGELVLKESKVYVPKNEKLRVEIIQLHHNTPVTEHEGKWKTTELVTRNYWWPGVTKNVGKYMEGCDMCQRMKNKMEVLAEKLKLSEVLEKLWTHLSRSQEVDLAFYFLILIFILFLIYFPFFYFQNSRVRVGVMTSHIITSVTSDGVVTTRVMEHKGKKQKILKEVMSYSMNTIC